MHVPFAEGPDSESCPTSLLCEYLFLMLASISPCFHLCVNGVKEVPQNVACFTWWEVQGRYEMLSSFTPPSCRCHAPEVSVQKLIVSAFAFKTGLVLMAGEDTLSPHPKPCRADSREPVSPEPTGLPAGCNEHFLQGKSSQNSSPRKVPPEPRCLRAEQAGLQAAACARGSRWQCALAPSG